MNAPDLYRDIPGVTVPQIIVKSADQVVNDSATNVNDSELFFYVQPYEVWRWSLDVYYDSGTTPDFKFNIAIPAGYAPDVFNAILRVGGATISALGIYGADTPLDGGGVGTDMYFSAWGLIIADATAATVGMAWSQNTSNASNTTVKKGSTLMAWNVTPHVVKR